MKNKSRWLLALSLASLCLWFGFNVWQKTAVQTVIGVQSGAVVLAQSAFPVLHVGNINAFGDLALKIKNDNFVDLATLNLIETTRYPDLTYTHIQPGLFLAVLNGERVFIMADPFEPSLLKPQVALSFKSDWVVLERSSLLPEQWPEPSQGWVVLGSQISNRLEQISLASKKPVVRPNRLGTVWLEKTPETNWRISDSK